jgi:hypothetical protein
MKGVYTASIEITALAAAKTLLLLTAPTSAVIEILACAVTNETNPTSEQMTISLQKITTLGSPVGTAANVAKAEDGSSTTAATITGNLTTEPTTYATPPIYKQGQSNLVGCHYDPIPEERPIVSPSASIGLRLLYTPSIAFTCMVTITYREIG